MEWITHTLGGTVEKAERREYGRARLTLGGFEGADAPTVFAGIPDSIRVWNSHGDHVRKLPDGFRTVARTDNAIAAIEDQERRIYAVEFHPEVNHTERGTELLRNFLFRVCKAEPKWSGAAFIEETTAAIRQKVGNKWAIFWLSVGGGSTVAPLPFHRAIGTPPTNTFAKPGRPPQNHF